SVEMALVPLVAEAHAGKEDVRHLDEKQAAFPQEYGHAAQVLHGIGEVFQHLVEGNQVEGAGLEPRLLIEAQVDFDAIAILGKASVTRVRLDADGFAAQSFEQVDPFPPSRADVETTHSGPG